MKKAQRFAGIILNVLISSYMILIIAEMPLYFTDGYGRIGTNKYEFFYKVTTNLGKIVLPFLGIYLFLLLAEAVYSKRIWDKKLLTIIEETFSLTDMFAVIYGFSLILSYLYSDYKEMTAYGSAWNGANGWYMGFSTHMMFLAIYFVISRLWKPNKWLLALWIPITFVVYFLGYCNRFGVHPIKMEYANEFFISTIGNINWYCGYIVTVFFGILYYWWAGAEKHNWLKWLMLPCCLMGFGTLLTQGSSSGLLTLAILCFVFFLMSVSSGERMQQLWLMAVLLGSACTITYVLRKCFASKFNYGDTLMNFLTDTPAAVVILVFSLCMYVWVTYCNNRNRYPQKFFIISGKILAGLVSGIAVLLVCCIVCNTLFPGSLWRLSDISFLTFNENWGSRRGTTWIAGMQCWLDQDVWGKLFGIGPDCMSNYIHQGKNPELLAMVQKYFPGLRLTNAHCEWLTILVNEGLLGLLAFGGMVITAISRYIKNGKTNIIAGACGVCVLAYTINNMVSFQQAMATTTMFVILGIGEAFMRKQGRNDKK